MEEFSNLRHSKEYKRGQKMLELLKKGETLNFVGGSVDAHQSMVDGFKKTIPNLEFEHQYSKLEGLADGAKEKAEYVGTKIWLPKKELPAVVKE